jgi:hypothetical protein
VTVRNYSRVPARVTGSDGLSVNRAAVVVIDGRAKLARRANVGGVEVLGEMDVADLTVANRKATIVGTNGVTWEVSKGDGCGCRSPLTAWVNAEVGVPRRSGS